MSAISRPPNGGNRSSECGVVLTGVQQGRKGAADQFVEWLYPELRHIAARQMHREGAGHSWQPTLLINELYLDASGRRWRTESAMPSSGTPARRRSRLGPRLGCTTGS